MGFRLRKSKNFGPFRINFSKSGIGYSVGGKGFRVTKTADGRMRETASLPGTGISYVTETKKKGNVEPLQQPLVLTEKQKKNLRVNSIILRAFLLLILIIVIAAAWSIHYKTTVQTGYTPEQLLMLDGHPKIYDTEDVAQGFYGKFDDSRIKVADSLWIAQRQRNLKSYSDDKVILYLSKSDGYIREAVFNLKENDFGHALDITSVFNVVGEYLPSDFFTFYKTDKTFSYSEDGATQYIYCGRLNGENAPPQYGYYFSIRATNFPQDGLWRAEILQDSYGGKSVDWIEKFSSPWEFDLSQYIK